MACLYVNSKNIPPFVGIIPNKQSNSTMHCLQEAHFMYTDMSKVIRQKKKCHIILVSQGCHGKVPQSGWLNNTILLSQTLKSGCLRSRCSGTVYSHMLGGRNLCQTFSWCSFSQNLHIPSLFMSVQISPSSKHIIHNQLGLALMRSF